MTGFESTLAGHKVDLIILEYPAIHGDAAREIRKLFRQSSARQALVIYGFTSKTILESFPAGQITLLQTPVSLALLQLEIKRRAQTAAPADSPDRMNQAAPFYQ